MKKFSITLFVLGTLLLASTPARADRVDRLISQLKTNPSPKVRVTAILTLRKYADPRVINAFISVLGDSSQDSKVRGWAAMALGGLRVQAAVPALKKAAKSSDSFLKAKARSALGRLCPSQLKGKRFYINMDKIRAKGALGNIARGIAVIHLSQIVGRRADAVTGWPKCQKPSERALRRKGMKAFYLDTTVKVKETGGKVSCHISVLFTTYPGQSIKGNAGARAAVPGSASSEVVSQLIEALVGSIKADINRFLNSQ
ncbi:MAG: HEAT repeat domain-containing protein [bacterium]